MLVSVILFLLAIFICRRAGGVKRAGIKNPVTNIFPERQINLPSVYHLIKSDAFITVTDTLTNISDPKEPKNTRPAYFHYVTFAGAFLRRNDKTLQKHYGLLTIDFDHVEDPLLLKHQLLDDEYFEIDLIFISLSEWCTKMKKPLINKCLLFGLPGNFQDSTGRFKRNTKLSL